MNHRDAIIKHHHILDSIIYTLYLYYIIYMGIIHILSTFWLTYTIKVVIT